MPKGIDAVDDIAPLLTRVYQDLAIDDDDVLSLDDLAFLVVEHWCQSQLRQRGRSQVRIYNPERDTLAHLSVVEITTDDMPFLVDSVLMVLNRHKSTVHLTVHPVMGVQRDAQGTRLGFQSVDKLGVKAESYMLFIIDSHSDTAQQQLLHDDITAALFNVTASVIDWQPMLAKTLEIVSDLALLRQQQDADANNIEEIAEFFRWLVVDNFTFLGIRSFVTDNNGITPLPDSNLGILKNNGQSVQQISPIPKLDTIAEAPVGRVLVSKSPQLSLVHRPSYMDIIALRMPSPSVDGEQRDSGIVHCILGLFTSTAYSRNPSRIPLLRSKVAIVLALSGLPSGGHAYKALTHLINTYPRDGLFQLSEDELSEDAIAILRLQERQRVKLLVRPDPFRQFYSCLVYLPRDRYSRSVRNRIEGLLIAGLSGSHAESNTFVSESALARIQYLIKTVNGVRDNVDLASLQEAVSNATRSFDDHLESLLVRDGAHIGRTLYSEFSDSFPGSYIDTHTPYDAAKDLKLIKQVLVSGDTHIEVRAEQPDNGRGLYLRFFTHGAATILSDALPKLENLGLRVVSEHPHRINTHTPVAVYINEFHTELTGDVQIDVSTCADRLVQAVHAVWSGQAEDDGFNQLVIAADLTWREAMLVRALSRYLRQLGVNYSEPYMIDALLRQVELVNRLVALFIARFDPQQPDDRTWLSSQIADECQGLLENASSLDDERIARRFLNLIQASLRTNYFQTTENGSHQDYLSIKFDPQKVLDVPEPRPQFEIFVFSPRTEGCHLRAGPVARGGLRWSDRREDFRTEVLGLVKAQIVKNAVIVPVGSKGGFVVKQPPESGAKLRDEVVYCYRTFIRGMLDITDNRVGDDIIPPPNVVRHDSADPYLVVAADKGTATFSDIANAISQQYGYWLDDAFASGGSTGYDHKKMGITARGAWESVKRHFRELEIDIQSQSFTVVGIGDMSGDVFGNGMLLSPHIRLVAAFNHLHIFVDPDPDPARGFVERRRLFEQPGSTWKDYDATLISRGGGVFERKAKYIRLSPEMQGALGTEQSDATPDELVNMILKAPVDLLFNGGIGTYVKASQESQRDAHDRANDAVRVDASELRCRVIGEGGNLGMTQPARVEFGQHGGRCFTDFIDNAGGVHSSDYEVNIKILLNLAVADGELTIAARNDLLKKMTEDVADLVLSENYRQTQALSLTASVAIDRISEQQRFVRHLEASGRLNRGLEFLPDDGEFEQRRGAGAALTTAELSVLLAYAKMDTYDALLASDLPEDEYLSRELIRYFPDRLAKHYAPTMERHPLRREIIATHITNSLVNRVGPTFGFRVAEATGASVAAIARAFTLAREVFNIRPLWRDVEELDNKIDAHLQISMLGALGELMESATIWFLRNHVKLTDIASAINTFRPGVEQVAQSLPGVLNDVAQEQFSRSTETLSSQGVPNALAARIAACSNLAAAQDIVDVSAKHQFAMETTIRAHFGLDGALNLPAVRNKLHQLPTHNHWYAVASAQLQSDLHIHHRALTKSLLGSVQDPGDFVIDAWMNPERGRFQRFMQLTQELEQAQSVDFAMLSVAVGALGGLAI